MTRTRSLTLTSGAAGLGLAIVLLAGCTAPGDPAPGNSAAPALDHIHELVAESGTGGLLVATHEGLYNFTLESDGRARADGPIGGFDFDPMGFTASDGVFYASGHPGPKTPDTFGTPNLGLIISNDLGKSWQNVSLTGQTDFHGLAVASGGELPPRVFGYNGSTGRVERSLDGGATWDSGAELNVRDLLVVGDDLYATTPDGLAVSDDDATTFTVDVTAPPLFILAADSDTVAGIDTTGSLWTRHSDQNWMRGGTVTGTPQALAVRGSRIFVADDRGISLTDDAGATWTVLTLQLNAR